jgi:RimJ/RimL family protein N-acetyltransferase
MIFGKQIELRPLLVTDPALLRQWEHDPHSDHWMATTANAVDARESYEQEFDRLMRTPRTKLFAVQNKDGAIVGFIRINDIDLVARKATVQMLIATEMQRQGYGTDALHTLTGFCFRELGLHRIGLVVRDDNIRALAFYKKHLGFKVEGCVRESIWTEGHWINFLHMGLLAHEWHEELP